MRLAIGIISLFQGAATTVTAFTSDDLPLSMAHRLVLRTIDRHSSSSSLSQNVPRRLSHGNACTICYDGSDPYHPNRHLMLNIDDAAAKASPPLIISEQGEIGGGEGTTSSSQQNQNELLTCSEYGSTFLSNLFPEDSSCRAFQGSAADICGCARPPSLCTLCDFGIPPAQPERIIPAGLVGNAVPVSCAEWDLWSSARTTPSLFLEDDPECDAVRSVGTLHCGCPEPCRFCGEGYRIGNPTQTVVDMQKLVGSVVEPSDDDEGPTCRDVSNAAATATALFSIPNSSPALEEFAVIGADESYICELYKLSFASTCDCIRVSTPKQGQHGCDMCKYGYEDPTKSIQVALDGIALTSTCANVDTFALLGQDVCSEITAQDCPCTEDGTFFNSIVDLEAERGNTSIPSTSGDEGRFDAVGVSLAVSTIIVIFASVI